MTNLTDHDFANDCRKDGEIQTNGQIDRWMERQTDSQTQILDAEYYSNKTYIDDVFVCSAFVWLIILRVLEQNFIHVSTSVLEQFIGTVENNQGNLAVAQYTQLISFLHQAKLSLCKRHLQNTDMYKIENIFFTNSGTSN